MPEKNQKKKNQTLLHQLLKAAKGFGSKLSRFFFFILSLRSSLNKQQRLMTCRQFISQALFLQPLRETQIDVDTWL